jgi:endonuclease G
MDRGHMCPAADRSCSKEDMDATFLMSNMVPQSPNLNRGPWEKLERPVAGRESHPLKNRAFAPRTA